MSIRHWPKAERPRERLIEQGAHALSDGELLAVLIGCGNRGRSAVDLARELIAQFGSLRELLSADSRTCLEQHGIGPARYASLQAALELARRHYRETMQLGNALRRPEEVRTFLLAQLRDRPYEMFCCLYVNEAHRFIAFEELFRGSYNISTVYQREVVRQCLTHNAAAVIVAHNHPTGVAEPSEGDLAVTRRLKQVLKGVDVELLDHIIVGDSRCFSFAERGLV